MAKRGKENTGVGGEQKLRGTAADASRKRGGIAGARGSTVGKRNFGVTEAMQLRKGLIADGLTDDLADKVIGRVHSGFSGNWS
jgi:hypothetical protein